MVPTDATIDIIRAMSILRTGLKYSGSFIELCKLYITPFPSKANTAIPKNIGNFSG
jgi:hypothetical protein